MRPLRNKTQLAEQVEVVDAAVGELVHSADQEVDSLLIVVHGRFKMMLKMPGCCARIWLTGDWNSVRFRSPPTQDLP